MNTLKFDIAELEIDDNENEIYSDFHSRYFDFNENFKTSIELIPNSQYRTITFSEVSSPFMAVITSNKLINAEINGQEFVNTKLIVLNTQINSIRVANVDLQNAKVNISVWGKQ